MKKVVVDTNVFISRYMAPQGKQAEIFRRWAGGAFDILTSEPILWEYKAVLQYERLQKKHQMNVEQVKEVIQQLRKATTIVSSTEKLHVVKDDPSDDKLFECAKAGGAEYIISGDEAVLAVGEYEGIKVISPATFLNLLQS
jgi:uncharacterized protein